MAAEKVTSRVTIALIQTSVSEDLDLNLKRTMEKVKEAASKGAQIVCLQELFRTRYFPQWDGKDAAAYAETIPGPSTEAFSPLARELQIVIIVPVFEKDEAGYYNSAAVIDADGSLLPTYRKVHIPHDPLFYEQSYFTPGEEIRVYDTRYGKFAALICYDQWFPEAARVAALAGAQIIFYPTAIGRIRGEKDPAEGDWHEAWEIMQRSHAIANSVCVAAVNRVGWEEDLLFWGSSFVSDSFGKVLARASEAQEEVLVAELDLAMNEAVREGWGFFRNRRPDVYWPLIEMVREEENREKRAGKKAGEGLCPQGTPRSLGYHMPAEWERHEAIWLSWPHDLDSFPEIEAVENAYTAIIKAIHESEIVNLLVKDEMMQSEVVGRLKSEKVDLHRVHFHLMSYADVWFRDYGPTFVVNREKEAGKGVAAVNWIFNAWGEKYEEMMADTRIACLINDDLKRECFLPGIVMEGGSIDVNGWGTVLTTEQCLLNRNRNPSLNKEEIESYLREFLGVQKIIWLKEGIAGDDTDGHVDDIARFVNPTTVLCAYEDDPEDENYPALKQNYELLCRETDQDGHPLTVIKLPMPGRVGAEPRLPASYANFYIGNEVVMVPVFGHENDKAALKIIQEAFPERKVVGINCREMVHGLGTIHCISQQQPVG
ncbi:MAG: agmatine deiminase family protein [Methanothrix sp.]|nr:agmatine deiminase family protein [Methanothrix sp.]